MKKILLACVAAVVLIVLLYMSGNLSENPDSTAEQVITEQIINDNLSPISKFIISSLETAKLDISRENQLLIDQELTSFVPEDENLFAGGMQLIGELTRASEMVGHAGAQVRLQETYQSLLMGLLGSDSTPAKLLSEHNPIVFEFAESGIPYTEQDIDAGIALFQLHTDGFITELSETERAEQHQELKKNYQTFSHGQHRFAVHIDAWYAAVQQVWDELTPVEQKAATSVVFTGTFKRYESYFTESFVQKIAKADSLFFWTRGGQIGLTPTERSEYPAVAAYFDQKLETATAESQAAIASQAAQLQYMMTELQTLNMMMNLNSQILFNGDATVGGLYGLE